LDITEQRRFGQSAIHEDEVVFNFGGVGSTFV